MADRFSRFNEDRDFQGNHFDQYEEGQLELEQASLDKPIESDNIGHRLLQKHGWKLGQGLGKTMQGRTDPVPIILKYDVMGMGRMEMELDYAEDVTEKRRALEVEKEDTEELRQKYKDYAEKEKAIAKALEDLRANFYCELCDKQYQKHQEFDNHINSYDHAHKQRLKELKQREFARNVSSKSRRDEKKQEKALRRLHELAEQRKQQDCAPGSGPMFKATTVAVDEESSEDGSLYPDGTPVLAGVSEGIPAEEKGTPSCGQIVSIASPKQAATATMSIPPVKNNSSTLQPKVGFSFSFAKKVPVKLETTASVFKELGEEVLTDESQKEEEEKTGCDPLVPPKLPGGESPLSIQAKAVSGGEEEQQDSEGGALASTLSKLKMMMKREEGSSHQEPQYYHYIPPAHCSVKPNFQFLLFMRASDQSSSRGESEESTQCPQGAKEGDNSKQGEGRPGDSKLKETKQGDGKRTDCKHKEEQNSQNQQRASAAEPGSSMVKVKEKVGSPKVSTCEKQPVECNKAVAEPNDGPRQPTGPFFPVLSKDESTTLQWPSELLEFTRSQPSLSYSCNPLYFDFKLSRNKDGRGKLATDKSGPVRTGEQQAASQKARLETEKPTGNIGEGTGNKPEQTAAASGEGQTEPAATSPAQKKDKTLKAHKQKKKKKKHKKSSKRSKLKERGSGAGEIEGAPDEKYKKRKKQKRKKSKSRASEEREDQALQAAEEFSEGGKRKRPIQDNHQRTPAEESSRDSQAKNSEPTSSSEEHNDAKRHKSEPAVVASSSSSLRKQSSSRGRRSQSRHGSSEEDESEDGDSSRRKSSSSRTQRHRRHYSEDSERSLSRSSRRGGRRHSRRASSHSRSDSSSSGNSSERSSCYSGRRGRSSSDSYSDYSECSRQRRRSKHSPTSDSDYGCSRRSSRRSHRRQYSSSESSRSRSNSRDRGSRRRRSHHHSSCSSSCSRSPSWKRSRSSYSRSSGSLSRRSSSSPKGSSRGGTRHHESSSERRRRRDFNRSKIYRSQSPRSSSRTPARRDETRTSSSSTSLQRTGTARGGAASIHPEPSIVEERNSLTARQLLEKVQARKGSEDGPTASGKAGIKLKDPPQGYFGPKLPPSLGNKAVLPLFGKLPVVKKPLMRRPDELGSERAEEMEVIEADVTAGDMVVVEPIREFPPPPPPPTPPQLGENGQTPNEEMPAEASACLFEPEPGFLVQPYPSEPCQEAAKGLTPLEPFPLELQPFPGYTPQLLEEEEPDAEEDSSLAPLESQPITFTPEEMEKYSKLQQAAQQHIQQQLLAKQVKNFPAAANLAPAPALQPIHIQQSAAATATATSITTVQHAILQHHAAAAAAAIGLHPHPHHHHPQQLAQVHHIPQHHLTPFSLSPLGHSLIPAHHAAFLSSHPIHIIPASAIHHTQLALHHVPHAALYPTLFAPRPTAAAAALHLHPFLHPIFSGQDLQHPPNHGS
ncbi:G patch domain-containing protein 8 isoform X1 [Polyodon spathula]|uniref:G patch domain-containing protein 8 isoform X1 n=3 Tax=Polyodon spathula TaxID=7913 RepID=UPI001B7ED2F0|nr:G patch domain-containing protein 8 isoform X1 [Polyodon spathula]